MNFFNIVKKLIPFGLLFFIFFLFFITPAQSLAQTEAERVISDPSEKIDRGILIFGPITVQREKGKPETKIYSFTVSDNSGPFLLHVANGMPEGTHRVSSGVVKLNGKEIFRPSEFSQKVADLYRQVSLLSGENLVEVRLRSTPGSSLTFEIYRLDKRACPIFGPKTFIRKKGKPIEERLIFESAPELLGPFTLNLMNGDANGSHRVDSAVIKLNGALIFGPSSFNEQVKFLSRDVSLQSTNTLSVELRGKPGDFLTIEITGDDSIPPSVMITSPLNGATFNTSPITVSGMVDDPHVSVTVNGNSAAVAPDGSFSVEGIVLQEGENTVKVIAVDACGNQGEDQILVYLRTVPHGPYLLLCAEPFREQHPTPPGEDCNQQAFGRYSGVVTGLTDETAVSVTLQGILMPDGVEINEQGDIFWGMREGNFFWAFVNIPQVDGNHPFTAMMTNAEGGQTEATVYFLRDTVPPRLTITSPIDGFVTNTTTIAVTGTVDDPEATVRLGWYGPLIPVANGTFATQYTLHWEGLNYITITANDPYGNHAYAQVRGTLDTIPPQINITNPAEGMAVNTPTIQVTGTITDQNINKVTVSVNGGHPQELSLVDANFSVTVTLSLGLNTLAFHAVDKAGNTASATRSVLLDLESPAVTLTTPQAGAIISGVVTVSAEASDTMSGITSVTLYVDGQSQTILNQPPFNFTWDTSPLASGLHTITIRAVDRAGNQAEASVSVTVDNTAPIVAITSPMSGAVVSGWITVSVQASDAISGMANVSLYVDGLLHATLTQPPFNFPLNTLLFASGNHTINARGVDNSGNQAEASLIISFDHVPPAVSITSPASGATVSGTITVMVEASDSISGVASVSLYINNQLHSTLNQPPFNFTVDISGLAPGSHTLTARAIDRVGNQAEAGITITVVVPVRIEITSPTSGVTFNKSNAIIQGIIYNETGEIGVAVNGVLAEVHGNNFAVIVPLQLGQNIITATATRPDGLQGQAQITINTETQQEFVRLTVYPSSGILTGPANILNVTFEGEAYLLNPITSYSWDFNGDGTPEITGPDSKVIAQYQYPGLYLPRVTVTDNQGSVYAETTLVHVLSREEMDALLRSKWEGMKAKLFNKDIPSALDYFIDFSKEVYQQAFGVIMDELPQVVTDMGEIEPILIRNNMAKYRINRSHWIDGVSQTITYYIYFVKDIDGLWRIDRF